MAQKKTIPAEKMLNTVSYYPFRVDEKRLTAEVNIADEKIERLYNTLFRKYGYVGNALTWDSMVEELISANDVDFMVNNDLDLNTDGSVFTIKASSKEELLKAMQVIQPTFSVMSRLEAFVKTVIPAHIQDGHMDKKD